MSKTFYPQLKTTQLLKRYQCNTNFPNKATHQPPTPSIRGGVRKLFVANIDKISINVINSTSEGVSKEQKL
jgi:hypothetical protein